MSVFVGYQPCRVPRGQDPSVSKNFGTLHTYAQTVSPKIVVIWFNSVGNNVFLGLSHAPVLMERGSKFWDFYMRAHTMRNDNQLWHGDQSRCEEIFYRVDHECRCAICAALTLLQCTMNPVAV